MPGRRPRRCSVHKPRRSLHQQPFPCAVYTRERACDPWTFSHMCSNHVGVPMPHTLEVHDLRKYNPVDNLAKALCTPFIVLVGGDVARRVSTTSMAKQSGHKMLYPGSVYSRPVSYAPSVELEHGFVELQFHSSMSIYDKPERHAAWELKDVVPVQSGMMVLPTRMWDKDVPKLHSWAMDVIKKCFKDSLIAAGDHTYSAWTLAHKPAKLLD